MADTESRSLVEALKEKLQAADSIVADVVDDDGRPLHENPLHMVDILTFLESGAFVQGIRLFPQQRIILKAFYKGTESNEHLEITDEEWDWIDQNLDPEIATALRHKLKDEPRYIDQLVLALGRRSFKSFLAGCIVAYEVYKLICRRDPQGYYGIAPETPIEVLTLATQADQSSIVFGQARSRIESCSLLRRRIVKITSDTLVLVTDADLARRKRAEAEGVPIRNEQGSVIMRTGHRNFDGLRGHAFIMIVYDEIAHFGSSERGTGTYSGREAYDALQPSLMTFNRQLPDGTRVRHGRSVLISSPLYKNGIFWERFQRGLEKDSPVICFRLPTWKANPTIAYEDLEEERIRDPQTFSMEYGAEFGETPENALFSREALSRAFDPSLRNEPPLKPSGHTYYLHLDPASGQQDAFAACLLHREPDPSGQAPYIIVVDWIHAWTLAPSNSDTIEQVMLPDGHTLIGHVLSLLTKIVRQTRCFVSTDGWNSEYIVSVLERHTPHQIEVQNQTPSLRARMFESVRQLLDAGRLILPPCPELEEQLLNLRRRSMGAGWSVRLAQDTLEGMASTDDLADALAGACYHAMRGGTSKPLPRAIAVRTGLR